MVARALPLDAATLPLCEHVRALIAEARADGRRVILASASHQRNIARVAKETALFDAVIGTRAKHNLKGANKLAAIRKLTGGAPFDYVGDSHSDRPIWAAARRRYSCSYAPAGMAIESVRVPANRLRALLRTMRPHQWAKNLLVFVPLATTGEMFDLASVWRSLLAALLFSLVASAIYQVNDLVDLDADRAHAKKRHRPLASGALPIPLALGAAALMLAVAGMASLFLLGPGFTAVLVAYLAITTAYSFRLKAVMTLDVIALACLYTIRLVAGAVAIGVTLSFWLLLFSIFFFLSLGYLKRYTELSVALEPGKLIKGRGYVDADILIVAMSGIAAGMVSILVMALFINDPAATHVYANPALLWGLPLCLLYWINRVWMMARRGEVDGDPVAFAIKDPRSVAIGALMGILLIAARFISLP